MTIVSMSLRRVIPRRVALQQSPLLLHQPPSSCHNNFRSSCFLQRTVPCPRTPCLTRGSHRKVSPPVLLEIDIESYVQYCTNRSAT